MAAGTKGATTLCGRTDKGGVAALAGIAGEEISRKDERINKYRYLLKQSNRATYLIRNLRN